MSHIFLGDPEKGILVIVATPITAPLCLIGPTPSVRYLGISINYDSGDKSSAAALSLIKGMSEARKIPQVYTWEENDKAEVAILFSYDNPPEALWKNIAGVESIAFTRCIKAYMTCEPDYPISVWRESKTKSASDKLFILQILSSGKPWTQFNIHDVKEGNPSKNPDRLF